MAVVARLFRHGELHHAEAVIRAVVKDGEVTIHQWQAERRLHLGSAPQAADRDARLAPVELPVILGLHEQLHIGRLPLEHERQDGPLGKLNALIRDTPGQHQLSLLARHLGENCVKQLRIEIQAVRAAVDDRVRWHIVMAGRRRNRNRAACADDHLLEIHVVIVVAQHHNAFERARVKVGCLFAPAQDQVPMIQGIGRGIP